MADLVTVTLPWGSLLRGVVGLEEAALRGAVSTLKPGGRLQVLASVVASDRIDGLECLDAAARPAIAAAWRAAGVRVVGMRPAIRADIEAADSSWARRLGPDRPVWRLDGVRAG
jgi:hypothetical protein